MPVTITVASHDAREVSKGRATTSLGLLQTAALKEASAIGEIIQTSLPNSQVCSSNLRPVNNGLVQAAFSAYTSHHHLVLRPEDFWFAILTQFSFYVNAHAEDLRDFFVAHKGKKGLLLHQEFSGPIDYGSMCQNMTRLIEDNIVDPKLRSWILPSFTTTTETDQVVASVLMMGTLQKYFEYCFNPCTCGIPTVTLLGEKSDYEDIERRIEKLTEYGDEPARFATLLRPIFKYVVATFDCTTTKVDPVVRDFWSRIIHHNSGSGSDSISGWMVAFCFWDEDGKCLMPQQQGVRRYADQPDLTPNARDAVPFHMVEMNQIPAGYASAPVNLFWNRKVVKTQVLAGSIAVEALTAVQRFQRGLAKANAEKEDQSRSASKNTSKSKSVSSSLRQTLSRLCGGSDANPAAAGGEIAAPRPVSIDHAGKLMSAGSSSTKTLVEGQAKVDSVQPVTGWWMYKVVGGDTEEAVEDFLGRKKTTEWTGFSEMRVRLDGTSFKTKG